MRCHETVSPAARLLHRQPNPPLENCSPPALAAPPPDRLLRPVEMWQGTSDSGYGKSSGRANPPTPAECAELGSEHGPRRIFPNHGVTGPDQDCGRRLWPLREDAAAA